MDGYVCQNMLTLAIKLAKNNPAYEEQAIKFFEHFLWIAHAINSGGPNRIGLWDEEDGFYYDVLRHTDGRAIRLKVRSMVGLIHFVPTVFSQVNLSKSYASFMARVTWFTKNHPELVSNIHRPGTRGANGSFLLIAVNR
jgi:hypothetical protein